MALSVQDFAAKIKQKYPQYSSLDDQTLTQKIVDKYPQYKEQVDIGGAPNPAQGQESYPAPWLQQKPAVQAPGANFPKPWEAEGMANIGNAAGAVANFATEGTIKPILKDIAQVPGAAVANLRGAVAGAQKPWFSEEAKQASDQAVAEPVNVPWLGNISPYAKNSEGGVDPLKTAVNIGAKGTEAGVATLNMMNPASSVPQAIVRGGLQAAANEAQNDNASIQSVAGSGVVGGTLGGLFQGAFNKLSGHKFWSGGTPETVKSFEKEAAKAGIKPDVVERLKTMTPEEKTLQKSYLDQALENLKKPDETPSPMEKLANDVTDGMRKLHGEKQKAGAAIGLTKEGIRIAEPQKLATGDLKSVKDAFVQKLDKLRVGVGEDGNLDFSNSTVKNLTGDQGLLNSTWDEVKGVKTLDDLIRVRDTLNNNVTHGKLNNQISASESFAKGLNRDLTAIAHKSNPKLGELDDVFSSLTKAVQAFQKKTGGSTQFTVEEAIDGTNTYNLLRKSLGAGTKESRDILTKLQALGTKYDIPELQNIMRSRRLAQTAEDIVGTDIKTKPTSFAGRLSQGAKGVKGAMLNNIYNPTETAQNLEAIKNAIMKQPKQTEVLVNLLTKPINPKTTKDILKHPIAKMIAQQLKVSTPQITSQAIIETIKGMFQ